MIFKTYRFKILEQDGQVDTGDIMRAVGRNETEAAIIASEDSALLPGESIGACEEEAQPRWHVAQYPYAWTRQQIAARPDVESEVDGEGKEEQSVHGNQLLAGSPVGGISSPPASSSIISSYSESSSSLSAKHI